MQKKIAVAIDGPSGAGKSTVARAAAAALGFLYVDTGAMYRAIGLNVRRKGISYEDVPGVLAVLPETALSLRYTEQGQRVLLNGEDVSEAIRTPEIAQYASRCSAIPEVRQFLLEKQRALADEQSVIMDGRDIGTVILPNAQVKIYLTASVDTRAARRCAEHRAKGMQVSLDEIRQDIVRRDEQDMNRPVAPLKQAQDAVLLDNSALTEQQTVQAVLDIIRERGGA
jgi:cytidylate kinase